jgi:hypothetical protein
MRSYSQVPGVRNSGSILDRHNVVTTMIQIPSFFINNELIIDYSLTINVKNKLRLITFLKFLLKLVKFLLKIRLFKCM